MAEVPRVWLQARAAPAAEEPARERGSPARAVVVARQAPEVLALCQIEARPQPVLRD
jgi:hypothetical protein